MIEIIFPKFTGDTPQASFLGRNGYYHAKGVQVERMSCGLIAVQPITMKGKTARCTIEIPGDAETLRELASALLFMADKIQ